MEIVGGRYMEKLMLDKAIKVSYAELSRNHHQ